MEITLILQPDDPRIHQVGTGDVGDLVSFAIEMANGTVEVFKEVGIIVERCFGDYDRDSCTILWDDLVVSRNIVPEGLFIHARAK